MFDSENSCQDCESFLDELKRNWKFEFDFEMEQKENVQLWEKP